MFVGENLFLLFERGFERKERELVFHIFETFGLRLEPDKPDDRYRDNGDADARQRAQKIDCDVRPGCVSSACENGQLEHFRNACDDKRRK